jgi:hypothetical protein
VVLFSTMPRAGDGKILVANPGGGVTPFTTVPGGGGVFLTPDAYGPALPLALVG